MSPGQQFDQWVAEAFIARRLAAAIDDVFDDLRESEHAPT